jgi:hypothetical protein
MIYSVGALYAARPVSDNPRNGSVLILKRFVALRSSGLELDTCVGGWWEVNRGIQSSTHEALPVTKPAKD